MEPIVISGSLLAVVLIGLYRLVTKQY